MESLEIILERAQRPYTDDDKQAMAARKNAYYVELIGSLTRADILPGALDTLSYLKGGGCVKVAIGSSSKNTPIILRQIGLENAFDAVADGNAITHSKPDPEVFVLAARLLGLRRRTAWWWRTRTPALRRPWAAACARWAWDRRRATPRPRSTRPTLRMRILPRFWADHRRLEHVGTIPRA